MDKNKIRALVMCAIIFLSGAFVVQILSGWLIPRAVGASPPLAFDHIVIIAMENQNYGDVIGNSCCPFINGLASAGSVARYYHSYLDTGGQKDGCSAACYTMVTSGDKYSVSDGVSRGSVNAVNIFDRLSAAGLSWREYCENGCPRGADHSPCLQYADTVNSANCITLSGGFLNNTGMITAANANFLWLSPDDCDNMHDCSPSTGDTFLKNLLIGSGTISAPASGSLLATGLVKNYRTLIWLWWDEYDPSPNIEFGPGIAATNFASNIGQSFTWYQYANTYSEYSTLRSIEANWGLPSLTSKDAASPVMNDILPGLTGSPPASLQASFSYVPSSPFASQSVSFTATASGGSSPYSFGWSFGDGSIGNGSSTSHTYTNSGAFTAKLTVTDSSSPQNSFSTSQIVTISSPNSGQFSSAIWALSAFSPSSASISNGVLTETLVNNNTGWTGNYWSTAQYGTPCCPSPYYNPPNGGENCCLVQPIIINAKNFSTNGQFVSRSTSGSTYDWRFYVGLYYVMSGSFTSNGITNSKIIDGQIMLTKCSNSGCTAPNTTYTEDCGNGTRFCYRESSSIQYSPKQAFSLTNFDVWAFYSRALKAEGLPAGTNATLYRIEPGVEGYGVNGVTVNWNSFVINAVNNPPPSTGLLPTGVSLSMTPNPVPVGGLITQTGQLTRTDTGSGLAGQSVGIEYMNNVSTPNWTLGGTVTTGSNGSFARTTTDSPAAIFQYRARFLGTSTYAASTSPIFALTVTGPPPVPPPQPSMSWSPSSPTPGQTVTLTASGVNGVSPYTFTWALGDGSTASGASVTHIYPSAGNYTVTLTVADSSSKTASITNTLKVAGSSGPVAFSTMSGSIAASIGSLIVFSVNASDPDARTPISLSVASLPPGASFSATPGNPATGRFSWTPTSSVQPGVYSVTFKAVETGTSDSQSKTISISVAAASANSGSQPPSVLLRLVSLLVIGATMGMLLSIVAITVVRSRKTRRGTLPSPHASRPPIPEKAGVSSLFGSRSNVHEIGSGRSYLVQRARTGRAVSLNREAQLVGREPRRSGRTKRRPR